MARKLFGPGVRGGIVSQIQAALRSAGFESVVADGLFGQRTLEALAEFQRASNLPASGFVDDDTWIALTRLPVPSTADRCLQLSAAFGGYTYELTRGNDDGDWLTWGIGGFTMKHGDVQKIVLEIYRKDPSLLDHAFGTNAPELLKVCLADPLTQKAWANRQSLPGGTLAQPWRDAFARFARFPEVQAVQNTCVREEYFRPAVRCSKNWGLSSELGIALCFDIQVQNGGISDDAAQKVRTQIRLVKPQTERGLREVIASAVAESVPEAMRADVLARKLTIARGFGHVHGQDFLLENWGLADIQVHTAAA